MADLTPTVYRFGDCVAVYTGGRTRYLTPDEATALASAIQGAADDVRLRPYTAKLFGTVAVPVEDADGHGRDYTHKRSAPHG